MDNNVRPMGGGMIYRMEIDEVREIFLSLPVSACLLDRETRYLAANHKYANLFDTPFTAFSGKPMLDFCPSELVENARRDFRAYDSGTIVPDHEIVFRYTPFLVSVNPVYRGADKGIAAISVALTDISAQKRMEKELAAVNKKLCIANKQIQELAETDALTGLVNRYGLDKFFDREIRRCKRERHPIAIAMIDVDYFKLYNDRHGHLAGDECLKGVGTAIRSAIRRPGDCAARYGGEEFVVVLPHTDLAGAAHVSGNIQQAIANLPIRHEDSPFERITVSIGVAGADLISRELDSNRVRDSLLRSADKALYEVKTAGRNGVKVWNAKS